MKRLEKQMGGKLNDALKARYAESAHWEKGRFVNLALTEMDMHFTDLPSLLYKQFFETKDRTPPVPLPVDTYTDEAFSNQGVEPVFAWYGHSAVLMKLNLSLIHI